MLVVFGGSEPTINFPILIHVNGGLEPRRTFFGGFKPMFYLSILIHVNGGLELLFISCFHDVSFTTVHL